jgi:predicted site-specific integrase-resolvase
MKISRIPAKRENKKVRVAVYCRVSTKKEEQEDSLEAQQTAYTELISLRSDWELVGVYADSLSGLSAEKRPEFMKMIMRPWREISTGFSARASPAFPATWQSARSTLIC